VATVQPSDEREPLESVLPGLRIHPLEEGDQPVEAFLLIKCREPDGDIAWAYRTTAAPNREELLGALLVQADILRRELVREWESD